MVANKTPSERVCSWCRRERARGYVIIIIIENERMNCETCASRFSFFPVFAHFIFSLHFAEGEATSDNFILYEVRLRLPASSLTLRSREKNITFPTRIILFSEKMYIFFRRRTHTHALPLRHPATVSHVSRFWHPLSSRRTCSHHKYSRACEISWDPFLVLESVSGVCERRENVHSVWEDTRQPRKEGRSGGAPARFA